MLVSEDEAKKKWCPQAIICAAENGAAAPFNRPFNPAYPAGQDCLCLGSGCMWWRYEDFSKSVRRAQVFEPELIKSGGPLQRMGFCGLAGRPE